MAWEINLGSTYTPEQRQIAINSNYAATKNVNLWELTQQILLCWYLMPYRISKFSPNLSPTCWRQCGAKGTLRHILWSCPAISPLWLAIFRTRKKQIYGFIIPISPGTALYSLGLDKVPPKVRGLISNILLAIHLSLVRHWKDSFFC